jgi:hypothetical protein
VYEAEVPYAVVTVTPMVALGVTPEGTETVYEPEDKVPPEFGETLVTG